MSKKIILDILYIGNAELLFNEIDNYIDLSNFSLVHASSIDELTSLCEIHDFKLILVDFNIENYKEMYLLAKNAKIVMNRYEISGKLIALSSVPINPQWLSKNDFDEILKLEDLLRLDWIDDFIIEKYFYDFLYEESSLELAH